jgi:hypothetical protein
MGEVDAAVELVESYLRLNGYATLAEFQIHHRLHDGTYEALTDVDIIGIRFPGPLYAADPIDSPNPHFLLIEDGALHLAEDTIDVILGEVKQGEAVFNPGLKRRETLDTVLQRFHWLYQEPLPRVVARLQNRGLSVGPARGGGRIRTRLVAFGRSPESDLHTISLGHIVEAMVSFMERLDRVIRTDAYSDPVTATLRLLVKLGFEVKGSSTGNDRRESGG